MARLFPVRSQFQLDTSGARRFAEAPSDSKGVEGKATASNSYPVLLENKSVPFSIHKTDRANWGGLKSVPY
jgi:hypothetical protein